VDPLSAAEQRLESQDFYMSKAKELKHIADKIVSFSLFLFVCLFVFVVRVCVCVFF
jgi:hypothetical protein